jgi:energy-converting hydrogenase Eha subunit G
MDKEGVWLVGFTGACVVFGALLLYGLTFLPSRDDVCKQKWEGWEAQARGGYTWECWVRVDNRWLPANSLRFEVNNGDK